LPQQAGADAQVPCGRIGLEHERPWLRIGLRERPRGSVRRGHGWPPVAAGRGRPAQRLGPNHRRPIRRGGGNCWLRTQLRTVPGLTWRGVATSWQVTWSGNRATDGAVVEAGITRLLKRRPRLPLAV